jgi:hypothetical protein
MSTGSKEDPWVLRTPPGTSEYTMYRDEQADPPALVCQVGSTTLRYHLQAVDDLHSWLLEQGDWVLLGAADEKKPAPAGSVEAWGRSPDNPVGGWYGLRNGYRGRFGMYLPPLLEALGLAELTHDARNNRMRAPGQPERLRRHRRHRQVGRGRLRRHSAESALDDCTGGVIPVPPSRRFLSGGRFAIAAPVVKHSAQGFVGRRDGAES